MLGLEKLKTSINLEKERKIFDEEQKQVLLINKNSTKFSVSIMDSDNLSTNQKKNSNMLPRLHDRYPNSLRNFRSMVLKNQHQRNMNT